MNSEELNRGIGSFRGSDEELLSLFNGMAVPKSAIGKDELWNEITANIESIEQAERFKGRRAMWLAAATIALIAALGVLLHREYAMVAFDVPNGKMLSIVLPDSSQVTINSGSLLKFRRYRFVAKREVSLNGEALFKVHKGQSLFTVKSGTNRVIARGTIFNVKSREGLFVAECIEGEVDVINRDGTLVQKLKGGKGMQMSKADDTPQVFDVNEQIVAAWTRGEFYFSNDELNKVFAEVERQFNVRIHYKGFSPSQRKYSGFFSNDNLTEALQYICIPMGLDFSLTQNGKVVEIFPAKQ